MTDLNNDQLPGPTSDLDALVEQRVRERLDQLNVADGAYRDLFEAVDEGFCIIEMIYDADGRANDWWYRHTNRVFEKYSGLVNVEGKRVSEVIPTLEQHWIDTYAQVVRDRQPVRFVNEVAELNRWYEARAVPFGPREQHQVAVLFTDVSEYKRTEVALREREGRLRDLFTAIDEGYCLAEMIVDASGEPVDYRFLEINPLFESMTGLVGALGKTAYEMVPNLERHWVETYARVGLGGETLRFENGSEAMGRWFDVFATPVAPRGRFALVFKDVTERKRIEVERAALLEREKTARLEAERATSLQRLFLGMVSHELRTPLASIKGFSSSLLATDVSFTPEQTTEFLQVIDEEADKLTELIDQLLNVVRLQAGTLGVSPTRTDIGGLVADNLPQLRMLAGQHVLVSEVEADLPPVLADEQRIGQVLINLVSNAAKFSPAQSPIMIAARRDGAFVRVTVHDEGEGIAPDEHERIFEAFHQVVPERGRQPGAGLGLAICKGLVEAHGGRIWVDAGVRPGTSIAFTLPVDGAG